MITVSKSCDWANLLYNIDRYSNMNNDNNDNGSGGNGGGGNGGGGNGSGGNGSGGNGGGSSRNYTGITTNRDRYGERVYRHIGRVLDHVRCDMEGLHAFIFDSMHTSMDIQIKCVASRSNKTHATLELRAQEIYREILNVCDTDEKILRIKDMIDTGPGTQYNISGRLLDTLVTQFSMTKNVCYYLDYANETRDVLQIVPYSDSPTLILFDIGSSYRQRMHRYSKTYFDCFGRGYDFIHKLKSGDEVPISICRFMFYIWADTYQVFAFLEREYTRVVLMRTSRTKRRRRSDEFTHTAQRNEPPVTNLAPKQYTYTSANYTNMRILLPRRTPERLYSDAQLSSDLRLASIHDFVHPSIRTT